MKLWLYARFRSGGLIPRRAARLAGLVLAIALAGCSPIETLREMNGVSKNDPDPQTAPFTGNMASAENLEYPNLATVPPPPTRATSTAERSKLTANLVAEREGARSPTPPPQGPIVAPPMPPPPALPEGLKPAADAPPAAVSEAAAQPKSPGKNRPESGRRKQGEPPEPGPRDTSMETPELASLPAPETVRPPLPAPALASAPAPSAAAPLQPPPAIVAAGTPQPPPPSPPIAMTPPPPAILDRPASKRPATGATLATIEMPGSAAGPAAQDRELIGRIAGLYKQRADTLRVVAYAGAPAAGADPLDSYRAALDRAQTVAKMLGDAGVPANRIQTEATPVGDAGGGRVEIQLLP
jgi:hypothetical protein